MVRKRGGGRNAVSTLPEKINLLIMRDSGAARRIRMRRSLWLFLLVCSAVMPLVAAGSLWFGGKLWLKHQELLRRAQTLELESQEAKAIATRLENLEALVGKRDAAQQALLLQNLNASREKSEAAEAEAPVVEGGGEGPGHNEFPGVDTGVIAVDNVNVRLMADGKLRVVLDVRNLDSAKSVAGVVRYSLSTERGAKVALESAPPAAANFRISRFKKMVLSSTLPPDVSAVNAQVIIEVMLEGDVVAYRNVFPVAR